MLRTVMKFRSNLRRGKTLLISATGRSATPWDCRFLVCDRVPDRNVRCVCPVSVSGSAFHFIGQRRPVGASGQFLPVATGHRLVERNLGARQRRGAKAQTGGIEVTSAPGGLKLQEHTVRMCATARSGDHRSELVESFLKGATFLS